MTQSVPNIFDKSIRVSPRIKRYKKNHEDFNSELYPFTSHYATIGGHQLHYLDEGKGHTVLLLHGNPTWSFYYRDLIKTLHDRYRVIAPDHIGMGLSDKPDDDHYEYTPEQRIKDLEEFIEYLGIEHFTLVGHDWGGMIGTCYATTHPEKIAGMVMMNTAGFIWPLNKKPPLSILLAKTPFLNSLLIRGLNCFAKRAINFAMKKRRLSKEIAKGYLHPYKSWDNRRSILRFLQSIPLKPKDSGYSTGLYMESRLKLLKDTPLFLCWGIKDSIFCPKILSEWLKYFPDADVLRIKKAGHYVLEDSSWDAIPAIAKFIDNKVAHEPKPSIKKSCAENNNFTSISNRLLKIVSEQPDRNALLLMKGFKNNSGIYDKLSYARMERESNRIAHGLEKAGITKGMHTVLMVTPEKDFFCILVSIFKIGAIPILIDPGMGIRNLKTCVEEVEPEAFIGDPKAHILRILQNWSRDTIHINVTVGKKFLGSGYSLEKIKQVGSDEPYLIGEPEPDTTQMIAFTSGNTSLPKGVVFTQQNLASILDFFSEFMAANDGDIDLATFPPFALMGPVMGRSSVIPDMDAARPGKANPKKLVAAINNRGCTSMFASPALIDKIGRYCETHQAVLPTLKRVISAGAPAQLSSIKRFVKALNPGVEVFTPYGSTEALSVSIIGSNELLKNTSRKSENGGGICVGRPVDGVEVAIIPVSEKPVDEWTDDLGLLPGHMGEITVRGAVVTSSYYKKDRQNRLAKIPDPVTGDTWHRMGDVGYFDYQGRLWMCGRKSHRVETADQVFYTLPCEAIYNKHPNVSRSALVGIFNNNNIEPVIVIELVKNTAETDNEKQVLTSTLLKIGLKFEHTRHIKKILFHPGFPVDTRHGSKIAREKLTIWAQKNVLKQLQ